MTADEKSVFAASLAHVQTALETELNRVNTHLAAMESLQAQANGLAEHHPLRQGLDVELQRVRTHRAALESIYDDVRRLTQEPTMD